MDEELFMLPSTYFIGVHMVNADLVGDDLEYKLLLVTDNTAIYEILALFNATKNKNAKEYIGAVVSNVIIFILL